MGGRDRLGVVPLKCAMLCMKEKDRNRTQFILASEKIKNIREGEYLGLLYTRDRFQ